ncbi:hypothetical protein HDV05_003009, partial [Chytridiales sp. JEL 0842]
HLEAPPTGRTTSPELNTLTPSSSAAPKAMDTDSTCPLVRLCLPERRCRQPSLLFSTLSRPTL